MDNYFEKYREAKVSLIKLINQFYDVSYTKREADLLNIDYNDDDMYDYFNEVNCVFHGYNPEGIYLWNKLGLTKPIYSSHEIWDILVKARNEKEKKGKNYYREFLELKALNIYMVERYYKSSKTSKNNEEIDGYYHLCESAGESAWNLLEFNEDFITYDKLEEIKEDVKTKLLKIDNNIV